VSIRMRLTNKPPCRLERGELRRIPLNPAFGLVGVHLCCPRCGFVTVALRGSKGLEINEHEGISFSQPVRCLFCKVLLHLDHNHMELEEDDHTVRSH